MLRALTSSKEQFKRIVNYDHSLHYEEIKSFRQPKQQKVGKWEKIDFFKTVRTKIKNSLSKIQNPQKNNETFIVTSKGIKRRIKTVQLHLDQFPLGHNQIIKNQKSHLFYSNKKIKYKPSHQKETQKTKQINKLRQQKQLKLGIQDVISNKDIKLHPNSQKHLLFLYQAKSKMNLVLRQRNIMKIRNLSSNKRAQTEF